MSPLGLDGVDELESKARELSSLLRAAPSDDAALSMALIEGSLGREAIALLADESAPERFGPDQVIGLACPTCLAMDVYRTDPHNEAATWNARIECDACGRRGIFLDLVPIRLSELS